MDINESLVLMDIRIDSSTWVIFLMGDFWCIKALRKRYDLSSLFKMPVVLYGRHSNRHLNRLVDLMVHICRSSHCILYL